jgi:hypothetical protein
MAGFPSPFGGDGDDGRQFDERGTFVPEHLPEPGPFLADHDVLAGEGHVAVHEITREVFEERTVYDMTFGYNLARLNLDARHPDAGYRYAERADDPDVLHAEFTPTTPFCPQSHTLAIGSFRAWNGLPGRHGYDLVAVRVHPMHQEAGRINDRLAALEAEYEETGEVPTPDGSAGADAGAASGGGDETSRGAGSPF